MHVIFWSYRSITFPIAKIQHKGTFLQIKTWEIVGAQTIDNQRTLCFAYWGIS